MHRIGQIELLVMQATPFCNINCDYCYLPHRGDRRRMQPEVLDAAFRRVLGSGLVRDGITVVWHAGEPLTLPPDWYEDAIGRADRWRLPGVQVVHHFQSNGLLLTRAWLPLLRRPDVRIGLSIDGPAALHDARRKTRSGAGTFQQTLRGVRLLQDAAVPFHVITVLSDRTLDYADALYDFYASHGIRTLAFNVEEVDGANAVSSLLHPSAEPRFRAFLRRFLERMQADPGRVTLREWDGMVEVIRSGGLWGRHAQDADPLRILSVDTAGNVSSFSPELLGTTDPRYGDFCFGNVLDDPLDAISERIHSSRLFADIRAGIAACEHSCAWFSYCGGGSPCNKLAETGSLLSTETMFCRLMRKGLLDVALDVIEGAAQASVQGLRR